MSSLIEDDVADSLVDELGNDGSGHQDVETVLGNLAGRQLDIVRSISLEGSSVRETAQRLGMTEVSVRVTLHRSLKVLAERYRRVVE